MFEPSRWALAFAELCGADDIAEGLEAFRVFSGSFGSSGNAGFSGTGAAKRVEAALRVSLAEAGFTAAGQDCEAGQDRGGIAPGVKGRGVEIALRFFCLLVKKGHFRCREALLAEMEKAADRALGIIRVRLETAEEMDGAFETVLTEKLLEKTGAKKIVLSRKTNPELLWGFRLYTGAEVYDTSLRGMLRSMERALK